MAFWSLIPVLCLFGTDKLATLDPETMSIGEDVYYAGFARGYASQFETPVDRAWRAKHKIKARLIGNLDPDEWDFPPKPKGMRWRTYNRHLDRFDALDAALDHGIVALLAKFEGKK